MESRTTSDTVLEAKYNQQKEGGNVRCTYEDLQKLVAELITARDLWRLHFQDSERARMKCEELIYEYSMKHDSKFEG